MAWPPRLFVSLKTAGMTCGSIIDNQSRRIMGSQMTTMGLLLLCCRLVVRMQGSVRIHSPAQSYIHCACVPNRNRASVFWHSRCQGGPVVNKTKQARVGPRSQWRLTPNIFFFSVKGVCCGAARTGKSISLSVFSLNYHLVRSRLPRGSLVSTHLSCGISGQADIGSTLSSEPRGRTLH